jgi:hypothetical protein
MLSFLFIALDPNAETDMYISNYLIIHTNIYLIRTEALMLHVHFEYTRAIEASVFIVKHQDLINAANTDHD